MCVHTRVSMKVHVHAQVRVHTGTHVCTSTDIHVLSEMLLVVFQVTPWPSGRCLRKRVSVFSSTKSLKEENHVIISKMQKVYLVSICLWLFFSNLSNTRNEG